MTDEDGRYVSGMRDTMSWDIAWRMRVSCSWVMVGWVTVGGVTGGGGVDDWILVDWFGNGGYSCGVKSGGGGC